MVLRLITPIAQSVVDRAYHAAYSLPVVNGRHGSPAHRFLQRHGEPIADLEHLADLPPGSVLALPHGHDRFHAFRLNAVQQVTHGTISLACYMKKHQVSRSDLPEFIDEGALPNGAYQAYRSGKAHAFFLPADPVIVHTTLHTRVYIGEVLGNRLQQEGWQLIDQGTDVEKKFSSSCIEEMYVVHCPQLKAGIEACYRASPKQSKYAGRFLD